MRYQLLRGDCLDVLPTLPDASVDSIVTDPPYEIGFMGKKWDGTGIAYNVNVWSQCLRVLKPGGHLLAFGGSRTYHRLACAIEDARGNPDQDVGFEIRDQIQWIYGSGFPKSLNLDGDRKGWGTALKPAHEPIVMARKPFKGNVADNVMRHGTGAINVDGCRVDGSWERSTTTRCDITGGNLIGGVSGGIKCDPQSSHPSGRWPANVIHDGSDEVLAGFPMTAPSKSANRGRGYGDGIFTNDCNYKAETRGHDDNGGSAARFFYCAKASNADRGDGNNHPTVKPVDLMRYLCRLVTPPNGLILDLFAGSGSTGKAAMLEDFRFVGIEREIEYVDIARARIEAAIPPILRTGAQ